MPAEHRRPNGKLCQGYYCSWCGQPVFMMGHTRQNRAEGICITNLELVVALQRANPDPDICKPHFKYERS